jgi:hypothetical protein
MIFMLTRLIATAITMTIFGLVIVYVFKDTPEHAIQTCVTAFIIICGGRALEGLSISNRRVHLIMLLVTLLTVAASFLIYFAIGSGMIFTVSGSLVGASAGVWTIFFLNRRKAKSAAAKDVVASDA